MLLPDGYHCYRREIGEDGNPAWIAWYGLDDEPVINTKTKCHRVERSYLDAKHFTSEAWFDTDGNPMETGDTYCKIEREFDERGNTICEQTYDANSEKIAREAGYDELRQEFNEENQAIRVGYFLNGELVLLENGYAALEREYDEAGNIILEKYFDEKDNLTLCKTGYAMVRREYDSDKRIVCEKFFGTDGNAIELADGAACYRYTYNEAGEKSEPRKYDREDREVPEETPEPIADPDDAVGNLSRYIA